MNAEKHLTRTREEQNQILSLWGRTFFDSSCQQSPAKHLTRVRENENRILLPQNPGRIFAALPPTSTRKTSYAYARERKKTSPPQKIFLDKSWGVW
jgi:hypothetical protein